MANIKCLRSDYKRASGNQLDTEVLAVINGLITDVTELSVKSIKNLVFQHSNPSVWAK